MAFSIRTSLFFFFTTLVLLSTQIHARDSYFFGKFHRQSKDQNRNNVLPLETSEKTSVEESIPNKKEQEQDPTFVPESENGYGLYGHETTYNNKKYDEKVNPETFSTPSLSETEESYNKYDEKYPQNTGSYGNNEEFTNKYDENFKEDFNNNNNNKYDENFKEEFNNNNNNKYDENFKEEFNNNNNNNKYDENFKEASFSENNEDNKRSFYNSNAYGTELERETPYKGYSHNLERQGMSDTRFMENGKYYHDLYNDKNNGYFYQKFHQKSPAGYYSSPTTENNYEQQSYSYRNNNNNNNEEETSFKDPYNSKWEKNSMNDQPEEFVEEQDNQFKP